MAARPWRANRWLRVIPAGVWRWSCWSRSRRPGSGSTRAIRRSLRPLMGPGPGPSGVAPSGSAVGASRPGDRWRRKKGAGRSCRAGFGVRREPGLHRGDRARRVRVLTAAAAFIHAHGQVGAERTAEVVNGLFGTAVSTARIRKIAARPAGGLFGFEADFKIALQAGAAEGTVRIGRRCSSRYCGPTGWR